MTRSGRTAGTASSVLVGVTIGGLVTFGFGGRLGEGDAPTDARGTPSASQSSPEPVELVVPTKRAPTTMLAWTASGIPASIAASLSGSPGVAGVVRVVSVMSFPSTAQDQTSIRH